MLALATGAGSPAVCNIIQGQTLLPGFDYCAIENKTTPLACGQTAILSHAFMCFKDDSSLGQPSCCFAAKLKEVI